MKLSKIEKGIDLYNQVLNSDKIKILEQNKILSQNIERYQEKNSEISELLEIRELEISEISKRNDRFLAKLIDEGGKRFEETKKKYEKRLLRKVFSNLSNN